MDYTKIKELKIVDNLEEANDLLTKNWLLIKLTTKDGKEQILLGRVG